MSSIVDFIVILWFVPVVLQVVIPLLILVVGLGNMLVHKLMAPHGNVAHQTAQLPRGG